MVDGEPLTPDQTKFGHPPVPRCLGPGGRVIFTAHARAELQNDQMSEQDALNVLRGGVAGFDSYRDDSYRYRVNTDRFCVVVAFDSETCTVVITAWKSEEKQVRRVRR